MRQLKFGKSTMTGDAMLHSDVVMSEPLTVQDFYDYVRKNGHKEGPIRIRSQSGEEHCFYVGKASFPYQDCPPIPRKMMGKKVFKARHEGGYGANSFTLTMYEYEDLWDGVWPLEGKTVQWGGVKYVICRGEKTSEHIVRRSEHLKRGT